MDCDEFTAQLLHNGITLERKENHDSETHAMSFPFNEFAFLASKLIPPSLFCGRTLSCASN